MTTVVKKMLNISLGDHVWISPVTSGEWDIPKAVKVVMISDNQLKVVDNDKQECWISWSMVIRPLHPTSVSDVDDMINLGDLQEYTILHNLHLRYKKNIVYTFIGMMLVAINPYRDLPLYGPGEVKRYCGKRLGLLSPHIYGVGSQSYDNMRRQGSSQCIVISGESGAGKTESTKLLMKFFTSISGQQSNIEQQLVMANPILEGFGNAKTVRNDNSSRFGKYIVISFNEEGAIVGACIQPYLLEKSRITNLEPGNRNYHIFYSLVAGVNNKEKIQLGLMATNSYRCLKNVIELTSPQAMVSRDAFVRALYHRLFTFIVDNINKVIFKHESSNDLSIGVLDIFGFEDFDNNSFEQLCINYANEQLQQFFVKHIFKLEQEEYKREQIQWTPMAFDDNDKILTLIGGDRTNIFSTTDNLSRLPSGTDASLVMKCNKNHEKNAFYVKPKSDISLLFGIKHYAGVVTYNVEGFLEKNRNSLSNDWIRLLRASTNPLLKVLFAKDLAIMGSHHAQGRAQTVLAQYRTSLEALMGTLVQCQPYFIRCIKPNDFKLPNMFDASFCCRQLRHSGLMDTAKIRSMGYPIRLTYQDFVHRYRVLVPGIPAAFKIVDHRREAERICHAVLTGREHQFGLTKVFLKQREGTLLELERDRVLDKSVEVLQKHLRAWIIHKRYLKMRNAAVTIQKYWRGHKPRQTFLLVRQGYLRLQAVIRSRLLRFSFVKVRTRITRFQARCKGYLVRKEKGSLIPVPGDQVAGDRADLDQWITSIFEAAIEGSEDVVPPSRKPVKTSTKKVELPVPSRGERIPMRLSECEPEEQTEDSLLFTRFAKANFQGNVSYQFSKAPLKQSLLDLPLPADQVAANALWVTILRFMGDLPEAQSARSTTSTPVMTILTNTLSRNVTSANDYSQAIKLLKQEGSPKVKDRSKLVNLSLAHKNKLKQEITRGKLEGNALKASYSQWLENTRSNILQKLHFIIGHGILRPELRDEIYCQICKQLSHNPNTVSRARGWALMALCVGCFAPSARLAPYLRTFLRHGPSPYNQFCRTRLQRTLQNGTRSQPPSWHELNAIRSQQSMTLAVNLSDGTTRYMEADSSITAQEICAQLADHIGLQDRFGFSLFITVFGEVIRLEAGQYHVMDAISQCEQDAQEQGVAERDTPWQLVFRKEMFAPWQGLSPPDLIATNLIYHQVVRGVKTGEYRCNQDSEMAMLAAQQYYIEHGNNLVPARLRSKLAEYIPARHLKQSGPDHWELLVSDAFKTSYFVKDRVPEGVVKADVVNFAKAKWPLLFSKYYEATQISGPDVGAVNVILAVNSTGVNIVTNAERVLLHLSYIEIHSVKLLPQKEENNLQLLTVQGYEFVYQCSSAEVVTELIKWVINSLKQISKYYIAIQDYSPPGGGGLLKMKKGDLVALEEGEKGGEWLTGHNVLSGDWGQFPAASVRVLPTILQPPLNIVSYFNKEGALDGTIRARAIQRIIPVENKHNLQQFAKKYFRPPLGLEELWRHSSQPLRLPLHKTLQTHPQRDVAVTGYMAVLKYMGDLPVVNQADLTEIIFQGPMDHEILRDELYCQLMKQLTDNKSPASEERGWELMCLATGLFVPSSDVLKELRLFLSSRELPLAYDSVERLELTLTHGNRKYPPHWTEVSAMQQRVPITHTVSFPNHTQQRFEVNSTTRIGDLVQQIGDRLNFQSTDGFSLVVSFRDKTVALANEEFLFDAIQDICSSVANETSPKKESRPNMFLYELMFMRKVWFTMVPGKDKIADVICHYPQEVPKYILGYLKCSRSDAATLAALIFRAEYGDNKSHLIDDSKKLLGRLLAPYHLKLMPTRGWKKEITEAYKKQAGMSSEEAKLNYLKFVFPMSTFGSSFFDVKLVTERQRFPENITVAINKNGIFILDRQTREPLTLYPFTELTSWTSTRTTFTLIVGTVMLVCATDLGYKMDDLVTSYTSLIAPCNNGV